MRWNFLGFFQPIETVNELPVGILFKPLKRHSPFGGIAKQALQLIPPMRRSRGGFLL